MTEAELAEVRADLDRPAGKDYDARCDNGSCAKDSRVASHVEELLDEVLRLRAWLKWLQAHSASDSDSRVAMTALAGEKPPSICT